VTDFSERTGGRREWRRSKREITHGSGPFHLGRVPNELTSKSAEHRVVVFDLYPFSNAAPYDLERDRPRDRWRSTWNWKQGIQNIPVIEDRNVEGLQGSDTLVKVYVNTIGWDRQCPKKARRMSQRRIHIMDLCARTGLVDVNSDQGECSMMNLPIGPSEDAFHEAHV